MTPRTPWRDYLLQLSRYQAASCLIVSPPGSLPPLAVVASSPAIRYFNCAYFSALLIGAAPAGDVVAAHANTTTALACRGLRVPNLIGSSCGWIPASDGAAGPQQEVSLALREHQTTRSGQPRQTPLQLRNRLAALVPAPRIHRHPLLRRGGANGR
jgi:hypothetical protein